MTADPYLSYYPEYDETHYQCSKCHYPVIRLGKNKCLRGELTGKMVCHSCWWKERGQYQERASRELRAYKDYLDDIANIRTSYVETVIQHYDPYNPPQPYLCPKCNHLDTRKWKYLWHSNESPYERICYDCYLIEQPPYVPEVKLQ